MKIVLISFLLCSNIYSQSVKKVFKEIKNNHIEEAIIESEKTNSRDKFDEEEKTLFQLGKCLLLSNEVSTIFKPHEAYSLFKSISISKQDEVNDFLAKYELSLDEISDLIFKGILVESIKNNTVSSYEAALKVCKPCNYEIELNDLKSDAAYIEAKNLMTFKSMNNFILNYPKSKHILVATDTRDSIALIKTNKDYISLLKYTKKYPNSKFTPKVIQELPDLLYKEAIETNTVESLKRFLRAFPKDVRCKVIDEKLSKIRYTEISVNKINNWKVDSIFNQDYQNYYCNYSLELPISENEIRDSKWGYLASMGDLKKIILNTELFAVRFKEKYGFIDKTGKVAIPFKYNHYRYPFNDLGFVAVELDEKFGFIDKLGKQIIPFKYDDVSVFSEGLAAVKLNSNWGFIDGKGNEIIPLKYQRIKGGFKNGFSIIEGIDGLFFINKIGEKISPPQGIIKCPPLYDSIVAFGSQDRKIIIYYNGKEIKVLKEYTDINVFSEGLVSVKFNEKWGFIDKTGKEVIPVKYDKVERFSEGLAAVQLNRKWGFIDKIGKEVIPLIYDRVSEFNDGISITELNNKNICINKAGKEIASLQKYDFESPFYNGFAKVEAQGNRGLIDKNGIEIIPIKYDEVYYFSEGFAAVSKNRKWGFVDANGNEIIPLKYDKVTSFSKGTAFAIENCEIKLLKLYDHELNKMEISSPDPLNEINANDDNLDEQEKHSKQTVDNNIKINSEVNNQITAQIYTMTDESPEFPGGISEFQKYITANINIPQSAIDNGYKGKCFLKFVVTDNGSITNIQIIRGVPNCTECNEEAKRLINQMPKWKPGKVQNRAVYSIFQIPINFDF